MKYDTEEPMAAVAGALIETKKKLENLNLLDTKTFEGFGLNKHDTKLINDPTATATELVNETYGKSNNKENKIITGGMIPPVLIPIIASVVGALAGKIYDTIKEKIQGKGYSIPSLKNKKEKHDYIMNLIKKI